MPHGNAVSVQPPAINLNGIIVSPVTESLTEKKSVIAGIRPEDILVTDEKTDDCIEVDVTLMEPAGSFNWVDVM